MGQFSSCWYYA